MSIKANISKFLRNQNLLFFSDRLRFFLMWVKNNRKNKLFIKENPSIPIPPDYLMYESFRLDYQKYYEGGKKTALWLKEMIEKYHSHENLKILDWGCGPARVIRHFPELLMNARFYGTDYNEKSISWNKKNIPHVQFHVNALEAKLPYEQDYFEVIYGISIFTHLSEEKHLEWKNELLRILKPNGILLLTLQGNAFKKLLTPEETKVFEQGNLLVRGKVKEGHRTYSAFHPEKYVTSLFGDLEILEHRPSENQENLEQDLWVFKKPEK